jgi:CHAT domain-containing protein/tetratricopeptide (TPR) repeat protein
MLPRVVVLSLLAFAAAPRPPGPRDIVREAERAVASGDTAALASRTRGTLERDSADVAALFARATLEQLTYRFPDAIRDYDRLRALPAVTAGRFRAFSALGEARIFFITARAPEAEAASAAALGFARATSDSSAEVLALINLGVLRLRKTSPAAALASFDSATRVVPANDLDLRGRIACGRASVFARQGRAEAVSIARSGRRLARRAGSLRVMANCLHVEASGYERLGRAYAADRLLDTAATLARRLGDRGELATILQWRGYAAFERQQLDSAQRLLGEAIAEGEAAGSISALAWSALNLGEVSIALDDPVSAEEHMRLALGLMRQLGDQWGINQALSFTAELASLSGDDERARGMYTELANSAANVSDLPMIAELKGQLAAIAARRHDPATAVRLLGEKSDALRRLGRPPEWVALSYEHGVVALWNGQPEAAEKYFRAGLQAADTNEHVPRYLAQTQLAAARLARGDTVDAERWLTRATDELDAWRAGLSDSTLRVLAFQVMDRFGGEDLGTASVLAGIAASGHVASAFELAERRRARQLRDALIRLRAAKLSGARRRDVTAVDASRVTLDAIAGELPDSSTALIELVTGRGVQPTTALVVTKRGEYAVTMLPIDDMRDDIARLLAVIESDRSDSAASARLGSELLGPALRRLPAGVTELVIVPEDALYRVPFAALRVNGRRVVERFAVHVAPSAAVALALWGERAPPGPARMLAFGDPRFPRDDARDPPATRAHFAAFASLGGLTSLPASAAEVQAAVRWFPKSEALVGAAASESNLKRARLEQYRLVHFATHAQVDERAPGRTAIALAAGGGEDGFVTSADLGSLNLNADLVMLSGCSTALGLIVGGEGILGLTGPLLQAGSHSVVATLWPVSDRGSADFVQSFYRFLASGMRATDALRSAQLESIAHGAPPRDWAAFELTGDGFVRLGRSATSR